jgi:hypothetical protein
MATFLARSSLFLARPSGKVRVWNGGGTMHAYMTTIIESMGLGEAMGRVGAHPEGMDAKTWRESVADDAARAVAGGWISLDLAHDMVFVADLLVAEMVRYPQIVDWSNFTYAEAAYHGYAPETAEVEIRGEYVSSPDNEFIVDFLESLIGPETAHA